MSHASPPTGKSARRPPAAPVDDQGRITEKVGVVVGIVTGVAGMASAVGFVLLPADTWMERVFIIVASLALSAAAFSGIGAWRNGRRFAFTATSALLALACLAGLSVAARAEPAQAPKSAPPSAASPEQLTDVAAAGNHTFQVGPQTVLGISYPQTAFSPWVDSYCDSSHWPTWITFDLNSRYHKFHVTVGMSDDSPSGDSMRFMVWTDGLLTGPNPTLKPGKTEEVSVDVTGIHRISLENECMSSALGEGKTATAVWINPVVT